MTRMAGSVMSSLFGDMGSPDYSAIGNAGMQSRMSQQNQVGLANARNVMAKDDAELMLEQAELQAKTIGAKAGAQQQSAMGGMLGKALPMIGGFCS